MHTSCNAHQLQPQPQKQQQHPPAAPEGMPGGKNENWSDTFVSPTVSRVPSAAPEAPPAPLSWLAACWRARRRRRTISPTSFTTSLVSSRPGRRGRQAARWQGGRWAKGHRWGHARGGRQPAAIGARIQGYSCRCSQPTCCCRRAVEHEEDVVEAAWELCSRQAASPHVSHPAGTTLVCSTRPSRLPASQHPTHSSHRATALPCPPPQALT